VCVLVWLLACVAGAPEARAVPPLQPWPAGVAPADGGALASNGKLWVFGATVLDLSAVGVTIEANDAIIASDLALRGCCTVEVTASALLPLGADVTVFASAFQDATYTFTVADLDETPPTIGAVEVVQVLNANNLGAPILPAAGPAWVITLDASGVSADAVVMVTRDEDDTLLTIEPATHATYERLITGLHGDRTEGCVTVEAWDASGAIARATPVCTPLAPPDDDEPNDDEPNDDEPNDAADDTDGCSASGLALPFALLVLLARRRAAVALFALAACAPVDDDPPVDSIADQPLCDDGFDDHTFTPSEFSDAYFDEHARPNSGWTANKVLVLHLMDPERRRLGLYDDDVLDIHDAWMFFRLMNGAHACGADEIAPYEGASFADAAAIRAWALTQDRLPPFLSWSGERLLAHDFYRLARAEEPRVYMPLYLTRDVSDDPGAYAVRFSGADIVTRDELATIFETLDPMMPAGRALYWKPSMIREAHLALANMLVDTDDPLAPRVRIEP
jgi:hypothetical protein